MDKPEEKAGGAPRAHRTGRAPLPSQCRKEAEDDAQAPARVQMLLESPSYRPADEDVAFLRSPAMRGVRLQLDFWKAEELLLAHGIDHTVVVYGSTRIPEPAAACRKLELARLAARAAPHDPALARAVRIAQQLVEHSRYYEMAHEFGQLISRSDSPARTRGMVVVTGGGPGIMEAANRGAFDAGMPTVGLNITLPHEQFPNPYISTPLCFQFHYFAIRKLHLLRRARAAVFFPGGYGTFDEMFEVLTLLQTDKIAALPVVLVGSAYWRRAFDVEFLIDEGMIDVEDAKLFQYAESAREVCEIIDRWYGAAPRSDAAPTAARTPST
jgi:uncharacterized protein (TIGR00730 family)